MCLFEYCARVYCYTTSGEIVLQRHGLTSLPCGMITHIPCITTYIHMSEMTFPTGDLDLLSIGPTRQERNFKRYQVAVHLENQSGMKFVLFWIL